MKIYHYHPNTGEYVGEKDAHKDPLESKIQGNDIFLIPANATSVVPPVIGVNEVAVYSNGWSIRPDFRGKHVWVKSDAFMKIVTDIGPISDTLTELSPSGTDFPEWDGTKWITNQVKLAAHLAKEVKNAKIKAAKDSLKNTQIGNMNSVPQLRDAVKLLLDALDVEYKQ